MSGYVYKWVNNLNGKWYSGSHKGTTNDSYVGSGIYFSRAVKKHGINNFTKYILYEGDNYRLIEKLHLQSHKAKEDKNSYNLKNEAMGGVTGSEIKSKDSRRSQRRVSIDGKIFNSVKDAAKYYSIKYTTMYSRCWRSSKKKYKNYKLLDRWHIMRS
jgi:hypothetical protein